MTRITRNGTLLRVIADEAAAEAADDVTDAADAADDAAGDVAGVAPDPPDGRAGSGRTVLSARTYEANRVRATAPATRRIQREPAICDPVTPTSTQQQRLETTSAGRGAVAVHSHAQSAVPTQLVSSIFVENETCSSGH